MDRIHIRELRARTIVGINDWEKTTRQEILISVTLHLDLAPAGRSDRIDDTVDYKALKLKLIDLLEGGRFHLIESVAEQIAAVSLEDPRVAQVDVLVDKQGALRFARSVAVEITRFRTET